MLLLSLIPLIVMLIAAAHAWLSLGDLSDYGVAIVAGLIFLGMYGYAQANEPSIDAKPQTKREKFCAQHSCIGDWEHARGYRVQCIDGVFSFSGGISGSCSSHGGNRDSIRPLW